MYSDRHVLLKDQKWRYNTNKKYKKNKNYNIDKI